MQLSIDPKPAAAFIEYTIRPLMDDVIHVVEELEKKGLKLDGAALSEAIKNAGLLYVFSAVLNFFSQIFVTSIICYTAIRIIH